MKKVVSLVLVMMMLLSCICVTSVNAEDTAADDTATVVAQRTPTVYITAENSKSAVKLNGEVSASNAITLPNLSGGTITDNALYGVSVYDETTAAADLAAWEGFSMMAEYKNTWSQISQWYTTDWTSKVPGMVFSIPVASYTGKPLRADSIKFKFPEPGDEYTTTNPPLMALFGYGNQQYTNLGNIKGAVLRVDCAEGTATVKDGANGYVSMLNEGVTLKPNTWYRAERILDTRIDDGTTAENWQRYIIYDNTDAIIGDSGWVMTGNKIKAKSNLTGTDGTEPFSFTAFVACNFPEGSTVWLDEYKSWALDAPKGDFLAGNASDYPQYIVYPNGVSDSTWKNSWVHGYSTHKIHYAASGVNGTWADRDRFDVMKNTTDYIYMEQKFMISEANTREFGMLDISSSALQNYDTSADTSQAGGAVRVNSGVLTVNKWDPSTSKFTDAVALKDGNGSAFSLTLESGKWYTANLRIDQTAYAGNLVFGSDVSKPKLQAENGTQTEMTKDQTTTARVIITDDEGNTYETEEFTYRGPVQYTSYGEYQTVIFADSKSKGSGSISGFEVNLDDQKMVLSEGAMDAEDALTVINEDFQSRENGATLDSFIADMFNPSAESYATALAGFANGNKFTQVVADRTQLEGVPTVATLELGENIISDQTSLISNVKLYAGDADVSELITGISYDADTKVMTLSFGALEPRTTYTLTMARDLAAVEGDIFSALPGDAGEAGFTFTTGVSESGALVITPGLTVMGLPFESMGVVAGNAISAGTTTLTSYNDYDTNYVAILALYNEDDSMESLISETGVIPALGTIDLDFDGVNITPVTATKLRMFVWDTWGLIKPIATPYVYPQQ